MADNSQYNQLGYNTDFSNGYSPSTAPDTSIRAWYLSQGKNPKDYLTVWNAGQYDSWKETVANRYDQYLKWYDTNYQSEAEKLARSTAIGQNPFYSDVLGSSHIDGSPMRAEKGSAIDPLAMAGQSLDMLNGLSDRIQSILNGDSQRALQDSQAYLNEQKATGQYLDNIMQQIGMGDTEGFAQVSRVPNHGHGVAYFGLPHNGLTGPSMFSESFFGKNREFTNALLRGNGGLKSFQLNEIMPLIANLYRAQSAFSGMSKEDYKKNALDLQRLYKQSQEGQLELNPKAVMEGWTHVGEPGGPSWGEQIGKTLLMFIANGGFNLPNIGINKSQHIHNTDIKSFYGK